MDKYSIKMRAFKKENNRNQHISGAEKIVEKEDVELYCSKLVKRALEHSKGNSDFINLKIESINEKDIQFLDSLPVKTIKTENVNEGYEIIHKYLKKLNLKKIEEIIDIWKHSYDMRGAILLDVDSLTRLEKDHNRGIRATYMDKYETKDRSNNCSIKNHLNEALILATKVVNHPNIIGELCISDDPDYITGYIASKNFGYIRITTLKEKGSNKGGRVFLFSGKEEEIDACIEYLEKQIVLVRCKMEV